MDNAIELLPPVGSVAPAAAPLPATPVKIWGARVYGPAAVGDLITISTSTGKSWTARVVAVVSTSSKASVVYAEGTDPKPARESSANDSGRGRRGRYQPTRRRGGSLNRDRLTRCEDAPCCGCCE